MKAMIAAKQAGQEVAEAPHAKLAPVIDLMDALKKSIAEKQQPGAKKPPVRAISGGSRQQEQQTQTPKRKRSTG
jgi:non-homologous end joining protein Ku